MTQERAARVKKRRQYVRNACNQCKKRKVKCSGDACCQQCASHRVRCIYGGMTTPSPGLRSQGSSGYEGLEENISQLQSSLDQVLQRMKGLSQDGQTYELGLADLLLQTAGKIETCRAALSSKGTRQPRSDDGTDLQPLAWDSLTTPPSVTPDELLIPNQVTSGYMPPLPFSKIEAFELIEYFRFEAKWFYPFIPFDSLASLAATLIDSPGTPNSVTRSVSEDWGDIADSRNLDMLRMLLACALASKLKGETEATCHLESTVSENLKMKFDGLEFDNKDIAVATLLSIYRLQCDETMLAWRKISVAAKMCQELGLHKSTHEQPRWVTSMFWCIYVLDKRFSFMLNLPFTLQDSDIEHTVPEHDASLQYVSSLIQYVRIAARFVPTMPKLGSSYSVMESSTRTFLDIEVDQWALSTSTASLTPGVKDPITHYTRADSAQYHNTFIIVCKNLLKLSLSKHALFSLSSIAQNQSLSQKAVSTASETIHSCNELQKLTTMYHLQAVHFNFFVLSAVATLYLAVRHAPLVFSDTPREIFTGLEILRPYCTSNYLCERVKALEKAMERLGYDGIGIGPQLALRKAPTMHKTLFTAGDGWADVMESTDEFTAFVPRLEPPSSFRPISQEQEEPCNEAMWIDSIALLHSWENQEWIAS